MTRVKRGTTSLKRRKNVLSKTKGYRFGRKNKERQANEAVKHAGVHSFNHRKTKKRSMRGLWNISISYSLKPFEISYSKFINLLKNSGVALNRKMLSEILKENPETFERIVKTITK